MVVVGSPKIEALKLEFRIKLVEPVEQRPRYLFREQEEGQLRSRLYFLEVEISTNVKIIKIK